jgi:hypothetical protein
VNLLYIVAFALAPIAQDASPSYIEKTDIRPIANAYAQAAMLPALNGKSGFELRVWSRDSMTGVVYGIVVANGQLRTLNTSSTYEHDNVIIKPAQLSTPSVISNLRKLKALVATLKPHKDTSISCGVMDGGSVLVDAALDGHIVTVRADNPSVCTDQASKIIVQLLRELRSQVSLEILPNN